MKQETDPFMAEARMMPVMPKWFAWLLACFGVQTNLSESEEISFAGGRNTADNHVENPPGDQTTVDEDIGLAIAGTVPRSHNFGHPDTNPET